MFIAETIKNIIVVWLSLFLLVYNVNFFLAVIIATIIINLGAMLLFGLFAVLGNFVVALRDKFNKD